MIIRFRLQGLTKSWPKTLILVSIDPDALIVDELSKISNKTHIPVEDFDHFNIYVFENRKIGAKFSSDDSLNSMGIVKATNLLIQECDPGKGILRKHEEASNESKVVQQILFSNPLPSSTFVQPVEMMDEDHSDTNSDAVKDTIGTAKDAVSVETSQDLEQFIKTTQEVLIDTTEDTKIKPGEKELAIGDETSFKIKFTTEYDDFEPEEAFSPLQYDRNEILKDFERQLLIKEGAGEVRALLVVKAEVAIASKQKREEKYIAIVRDYTGSYCVLLFTTMGWRGNKYNAVGSYPISEKISIQQEANRKSNFDSFILALDDDFLTIECSTAIRKQLTYGLYFAFNAMYHQRTEMERWKFRLLSLQLATRLHRTVTVSDATQLEGILAQLNTPKLKDIFRIELYSDLRKYFYSAEGRDYFVHESIIKLSDTELELGMKDTYLHILELFLRLPTFDGLLPDTKFNYDQLFALRTRLLTALEIVITQARSESASDIYKECVGMKNDIQRLFLVFDTWSDSISSVEFPDVFNLGIDTFVPERKFGKMLPTAVLQLHLVWLADNDEILTVKGENLPSALVLNNWLDEGEMKCALDSLSRFKNEEFLRYNVNLNKETDKFMTGFAAAYKELKELCGIGKEDILGLVYDREINFKRNSSQNLFVVKKIPKAIPFADTSLVWQKFTKFEHYFYQKYMNLPYTTRLDTLSSFSDGPRFLKGMVDYFSVHPRNLPLDPGLYLGVLHFHSSFEDLSILVPENRRYLPPIRHLSEVTDECVYWIQSLRFRKRKHFKPLPADDPMYKFQIRFETAYKELAQEMGVNSLGLLYDHESICLNENIQSWGMFFVQNVSSSVPPPGFTYVPVTQFSNHFFSSCFPSLAEIWFSKMFDLQTKEALLRQQYIRAGSSFSDTDNEMFLAKLKKVCTDLYDAGIYLESLQFWNRIIFWFTGDRCSLLDPKYQHGHSIVDYVDSRDQDSLPLNEILERAAYINQKNLGYYLHANNILLTTKLTSDPTRPDFEGIASQIQSLRTRYREETPSSEYENRHSEKITTIFEKKGEYVPHLKPLEVIDNELPDIETFDISFSLEQLLDFVEFDVSPHDFCACIVEEIVETALVDAVDVVNLMQVEETIRDMISMVEIMDNLTEDTGDLVAVHISRDNLKREKAMFVKKLESLYKDPAIDMNADLDEEFIGKAGNELERSFQQLLNTPYSKSINVVSNKFYNMVSVADSFLSLLDSLHDLEEIVEMVEDIKDEARTKVSKSHTIKAKVDSRPTTPKSDTLTKTFKTAVNTPSRNTKPLTPTKKTNRNVKPKKKVVDYSKMRIDKKKAESPSHMHVPLESLFAECMMKRVEGSPMKKSAKHMDKEIPSESSSKVIKVDRKSPPPGVNVKYSNTGVPICSSLQKDLKAIRKFHSYYRTSQNGTDSTSMTPPRSTLVDLDFEPIIPTSFTKSQPLLAISANHVLIRSSDTPYELAIEDISNHCNVEPSSVVDLTRLRSSTVESVVMWLLDPSLLTFEAVEKFDEEIVDLLIAAEALQFPLLWVYSMNIFYLTDSISTALGLIRDSFIFTLQIPTLIQLEGITQLPIFDLIWCVLTAHLLDWTDEYRDMMYSNHIGNWAYKYAQNRVQEFIKNGTKDIEEEILDEELELWVGDVPLGERVLIFNVDGSNKFTDECLSIILLACPNLIELSVANTPLTDETAIQLASIEDNQLQKLNIKGTRLTRDGVEIIYSAVPGITITN
eukprot:TRINITY_DN2913_c0_g1_i1.p1 TRINITY_DN2913_c0_g1~~TRINITY_DN2913_c0_g1_i1.p1  ORF type:complete len:1727 (-),score=448.40 TRINITY_DN2913_c0_g1_i1:3-5183(-)